MDVDTNQLLNAVEAAKLAGVPYTTFCYHKYHNATPKPIPVGKMKFYLRSDILAWEKPKAKKRGPKGKLHDIP